MIPLVGDVNELKYVKNIVTKVADEIISASGIEMKYMVGTMIEIPVSYTHLDVYKRQVQRRVHAGDARSGS